jgi:hypothetical protein
MRLRPFENTSFSASAETAAAAKIEKWPFSDIKKQSSK